VFGKSMMGLSPSAMSAFPATLTELRARLAA
jgi:hypothetical protein